MYLAACSTAIANVAAFTAPPAILRQCQTPFSSTNLMYSARCDCFGAMRRRRLFSKHKLFDFEARSRTCCAVLAQRCGKDGGFGKAPKSAVRTRGAPGMVTLAYRCAQRIFDSYHVSEFIDLLSRTI
jgi:hypothetical protein